MGFPSELDKTVNKSLLILSVLLVSQVLFAGSEKLTPTQQVSEYLRLLNSKNSHLDAETRQATIEKFAELITPLSRRYGKGVLRINEQQWIEILLEPRCSSLVKSNVQDRVQESLLCACQADTSMS